MFGLTKDAINVTDAAIEHFKRCMNMDSTAIGMKLRIVDGRGCGGSEYDIDFIHELSDENDLLDLGDNIKLYIPKTDILKLFGTKIDFITDSLGTKRIEISNPNEKYQCGCGMSVNFEE